MLRSPNFIDALKQKTIFFFAFSYTRLLYRIRTRFRTWNSWCHPISSTMQGICMSPLPAQFWFLYSVICFRFVLVSFLFVRFRIFFALTGEAIWAPSRQTLTKCKPCAPFFFFFLEIIFLRCLIRDANSLHSSTADYVVLDGKPIVWLPPQDPHVVVRSVDIFSSC